MSDQRKIRLGAFLRGPGHHVAAWRHPDVPANPGLSLKHYAEGARTAERGLFDMAFLADSLVARNGDQPIATFERTGHVAHFEPLTLLSALSALTEHIGLVATASTTYDDPFHMARVFASLDHLSGGRAGWNVVTSADPGAAANFSRDRHLNHAERYDRALEFVTVVKKLWDSYDDDAFVADKASGIAIDRDKIHVANHIGRHFQVRGPLNVARPPQGHPVIVQAGSSDAGQDLAAETAEVVFTAHANIGSAKRFYSDLKGRLARFGRSPGGLKIMPGIFPVIGRTQAEAEDKYDAIQDLIDPVVGLALASGLLGGVDLSSYPLDGPLPDLPESETVKSRFKLVSDLAHDRQLTIRELYKAIAGARGHYQIVGTANDVADLLEEWFTEGAADGFNIMPPIQPSGLSDFVDTVVPELQRRSLFRTAYEGETLRENLGLERPLSGSQLLATQRA
ncbi:LLM class flavin-dependent oxidoreductase [Kaistia dalseonensis]|uniref:Alkanesulfonate monooxygenase n=1 Tax=Kaistia dalseonensis TaxID=410840 RepID=A0ABU0H467_9HYPH|nr:LLM class flavin-dependent oxidoreductase [Kaistia dalseonensis]MCX5493708.1 LLM class flavin-dependent oxidoreductase [Kaistia dalseonensis]MDQ0436271.1 alkanesulfonate monooxygenase [Kaistia dalseonensis]